MLSDFEKERYKRHLSLPGFGEEGQEKLRRSSVLVVGAGGLGSPVALYLAAAGIGNIAIIDGDRVDSSNLQRQVIHSERNVGKSKVESAAEHMRALNHEVRVDPIFDWVTPDNIDSLIGPHDFIVDATDNFRIKFLLNDACVRGCKPFSHGAISQYAGHTMTYVPGSACYRCLFDSEPPSVEPSGPLGVLPGVIGVIQATEAIKYITGVGQLLTNRLLTYDSLTMTFRNISLQPRPDCACRAKTLC